MQNFQDKVVWITGASSGYGEALARAFDKAGAKLILSARREDVLKQLAAELRNAKAVPIDLGQSETFAAKCSEAIGAFGHIDIVVHNGALGQNGSALETRPAVAREIMEVDYFSYTELTRCLLPHFTARKSGQIVVISGLVIAAPAPGRSTYAAAKAALFGYFNCLRAETIGQGIDITILIPGAMQTDLIAKALKADGSLVGGVGSSSGVSVEEAARQSLEVIAQREYEAYIGDESGRQLWQLFHQDPNRCTAQFLERIQAQMR